MRTDISKKKFVQTCSCFIPNKEFAMHSRLATRHCLQCYSIRYIHRNFCFVGHTTRTYLFPEICTRSLKSKDVSGLMKKMCCTVSLQKFFTRCMSRALSMRIVFLFAFDAPESSGSCTLCLHWEDCSILVYAHEILGPFLQYYANQGGKHVHDNQRLFSSLCCRRM